jgi:lipopolysaccharide export system protein LptA
MRIHFKYCLLAFLSLYFTQAFSQEKTKIQIEYAGSFDKNDEKFPGASIFSKKGNKRVKFVHEGAELYCDRAVLYKKTNNLRAWGKVVFKQGDTISQNSDYVEYNGDSKLAKSQGNVVLQTPEQTLTVDTLYFDREKDLAYYNSFGTVKDSANVLTSNRGRYYLAQKKYQFVSNVKLTHPDYTVNSSQLDYYTNSGHAYLYGKSVITGEEYQIFCERGFFDTENDRGYFVKNSQINYSNRIINGDSLFFDNKRGFASATNYIKITDTINKGIVKGHYAEVFKAKDSVFITKRAVAINLVENDSVYIHADTLMVTGKPENRIIRGFYGAKFFKKDMSGKSDSIHVNNKKGLTQMLGNPILWSGESQMTGDTIHLINNLETEKLDSLKVLNNAFIVQQDTLTNDAYNQVKGDNLYGKFIDNSLKHIDVVKNTEVIYYMRGDEGDLIGIDKTVCGTKINLLLIDNQIQDITFYTDVDGQVNPEKDLPPNARKLRGFIWKGSERLLTKDDIFDEDDNNIILPRIRGLDERLDMEDDEDNIVNKKNIKKPSKKEKAASIRPLVPNNEVIALKKQDTNANNQNIPYLRKGYYVIVGVFKNLKNAEGEMAKMNAIKSLKNPIKLGYLDENTMYYLFENNYPNLESARQNQRVLILNEGYDFKNAWLLTLK